MFWVHSFESTSNIRHSLFIDDMKVYNKSSYLLRSILSVIQGQMKDARLIWNSNKCNVLHITRGKVDHSYEDMVLEDGKIIKCLKYEENYE